MPLLEYGLPLTDLAPEELCGEFIIHPSEASWPELYRRYNDKFYNIMALTEMVRVIPVHSADCERGFNYMKMVKSIEMVRVIPVHSADCERAFNYMKMVKSDTRSRLGQVALTLLLRVQMDSPEIENLDPEEAL